MREIGTLGHSQGATGAVNAMIKSGGLIKTVIAIELPRQFFCSSKVNSTDTKNLTAGSIFFIDGSKDGISPPTQYSWESGEQSIQAYYDATPSGIAKVKGTLIGPDHLDVIGQPAYCVFEPAETCAQPPAEFGQLISAKEYKRNDSND